MSNLGFIQLQRAFFSNPLWLNLPTDYRSIFTVILANCAWKEVEMDDFGKKIILKPGQLLMTEREIISQAFPPTTDSKLLDKYKSAYRRAIKKFKNIGFSYHETYHKKTLHTIISTDIFAECVPRIDPNSYQTRTKLVPQKNKDNKKNKEIKETPPTPKGEEVEVFLFRSSIKLSKVQHEILISEHGMTFTEKMFDILDAYKGSTGKKYKSDYHTMKKGGWVNKRALEETKTKIHPLPIQVDRRTQNVDGSPINSPADGRF